MTDAGQHEPAIRGILFDLWNTLAFTDHTPNPVAALAAAFGLDATPRWRKQIERCIMTRRLSGIGEAIEVIAAETGRRIDGRLTRRDAVSLAWTYPCRGAGRPAGFCRATGTRRRGPVPSR